MVKEKKIPWPKADEGIVEEIEELFSIRKVILTDRGKYLAGDGLNYQLWSNRLGGKMPETITGDFNWIIKELMKLTGLGNFEEKNERMVKHFNL